MIPRHAGRGKRVRSQPCIFMRERRGSHANLNNVKAGVPRRFKSQVLPADFDAMQMDA